MKNWWRKVVPGGERLKMPSRRVTIGFLILYGLPALLAIASGAHGAYVHSVSKGLPAASAFLQALQAGGLFLLVHALIGVTFFYYLTLLTSIVIPDTIAAYHAARRGIAALPSAWRNFVAGTRAACQRGRDLAGICARGLAALPGRIRAMTAADWTMALFAVGTAAIFGSVLYFGWGWASAIHAWLPKWMQDDHSFVFSPEVLMIDVLISIIPIVFLTTVWGELMRPLVRWARSRSTTSR